MNRTHESGHRWGRQFLDLQPSDSILDIGCGGGRNLQAMQAYVAFAAGIDPSPASVEMSTGLNRKAIKSGQCEIKQGASSAIPYAATTFDVVTAFETIYYWDDLAHDFTEVFRVLKDGGRFIIGNGLSDSQTNRPLANRLNATLRPTAEIVHQLRSAGFYPVVTKLHENNAWIVFIAIKPEHSASEAR